MYDIPCKQNLKRNNTNELIHKTETNSQTMRRSLWLPGGRVGETDTLGYKIVMYTLLYLKWIINKDLP